ncbi:uncharacterized protein [Littorina saxatilis]|uniref:Uncharacterized protein n=1 Tax=Littorina saxatilis TaxID=31220 RepID=A0AAN9G300_9CAEN
MKSTTVAIVAVLLLFVFRLDTQVFISAGGVMARDVKRAVCPSVAINIAAPCDQKNIHLKKDSCPWLKAQKDCLRELYLTCYVVNVPMAMLVEILLGDADKQHYAECVKP